MRRGAIVWMAVVGILSPAGVLRADDMAEADLTALIRGKTVYLETTAES